RGAPVKTIPGLPLRTRNNKENIFIWLEILQTTMALEAGPCPCKQQWQRYGASRQK
ncbi:hypothetical protein A2U01_0110246, partial [Trifolium medium]|nr:hypothetical protein [Trifolium medium]